MGPFDTIRKIPVILLGLLTCVCASAKTYWCSPDGVSDGSSYNRPGSFAALVSGLAAGDTLYMRGGQYDSDHQINIGCSGTADRRIVFMACPGEKPVLDFRREPYGRRGLVIVQGADWLHLCGLTVRYAGKNGVHNSGSHNIFERLDVYGNGDSGRAAALVASGYLTVGESSPEVAKDVISFHVVDHLLGCL